MKTNKILLTLIIGLFISTVSAQVGIGTTSPNGALDVTSTNNGLLIPRIALSATNVSTVLTPTTSELVYNTFTSAVGPNQVTPGFYYWNGSLWVRLNAAANSDWALTGNSGTTAGTNFVGTTDAQDLRFKTNSTDRLNISNTNGQIQSYYAGTAATPAYSWNSDSDTGMYRIAANTLGLGVNGVEKVRIANTEAVVNEQSNNYDFRIETDNNQYGLFSDASQDAIIFGSAGNLFDDGVSFTAVTSGYSNTINYVADFDAGTSRGTTMGLGSIEYLVDGEAELFISDNFSPVLDITYDLGYENSWDDIYADDFWNVSDIRAKKDIVPMKYGLNEIMKLTTISYKLKNDPFQDQKIGLIAQEVNKFIPEASKTHNKKKNEKGEFETKELDKIRVSYVNLVPVLIKSVQEQQEIIESQNTRIDKLEKMVEQLLNR